MSNDNENLKYEYENIPDDHEIIITSVIYPNETQNSSQWVYFEKVYDSSVIYDSEVGEIHHNYIWEKKNVIDTFKIIDKETYCRGKNKFGSFIYKVDIHSNRIITIRIIYKYYKIKKGRKKGSKKRSLSMSDEDLAIILSSDRISRDRKRRTSFTMNFDAASRQTTFDSVIATIPKKTRNESIVQSNDDNRMSIDSVSTVESDNEFDDHPKKKFSFDSLFTQSLTL